MRTFEKRAFIFKAPFFYGVLISNKNTPLKFLIFSSRKKAKRYLKKQGIHLIKKNKSLNLLTLKILRLLKNGRKANLKEDSFFINQPHLSKFAKKVFEQVQKIPFGETKTYKQIAIKAGKPKAFRVVGQILKKNFWPIIIPCHRVTGVNLIGGYLAGVKIKRKLLKNEKMLKINNKVKKF